MSANVTMFLRARAQARAAGDYNLARSIQADLDRLGYVERVETPDGMETTAVRAPERAVPTPKRRATAAPGEKRQ
jgi:hypothetical protein